MRKALNMFSVVVLLCCTGLQQPARIFAQTTPAQTTPAQTTPAPQTPDIYADKIREFEEFARVQMERDRIPGMTIGFFKGDYTWVKGFGYADLENKTPAHADSAYRLASITKSMTGTAIVQLAERGKLDLDGEIQTYVPYYPKQKWPVTVRQLLVHLGGGQVGSGIGPEHVTTREVVARIAKYPIELEPGTQYSYQTSGYNLLGAAIEEVSGKPFETYMRENLWLPLGMKDTRVDNVRDIVANRVRGYDLSSGELKNAPFIDVSSRFGGGGATGTVPDLLRWARGILSGKIVSGKWIEEMLTPVATKSGRWSGLGDGDEYYTLGWIIKPINGNFSMRNEGSQKGTDTAVIYFPEKNLAIAAACNLEFAPTYKYIHRLYELVTGEKWDARVYTHERTDAPLARALNDTYNYGSLHFEQHHAPLAASPKELADAFAYFNTNASRERLRADFKTTAQKIADGRHPVGGNNLIKVGSYIAARLKEKHGAAAYQKYYTSGAIPFFADYVRLYKSDAKIPKELRFTPTFEKLVERWDADWARTWNDFTRQLVITPATDFDAVGARLRKEFAGAEVYPDFTVDIQPIQSGIVALKSHKFGIDLYSYSDELLFNWGFFIILSEMSAEGRAAIAQHVGEYERPAVYFKRAFDANPNGVMRSKTFTDIGARWLARPQMYDGGIALLRAGIEVHPKDAALHAMLADFLLKKGQKDEAVETYRKAFALDPNFGKGVSIEDYIARKMSN
ncbi:MAG TPA: serine hydrolase [Pyrinomonadaceae bacterium]|nr:serine hydrolase [Pyrinomonadaceae bacterium]